jgi:tripartite-type tricarboxylate transporter receptor subunit TctC
MNGTGVARLPKHVVEKQVRSGAVVRLSPLGCLAAATHPEGVHGPFVGEAAGNTALLGGQIDIMTMTSGTAGPPIRDWTDRYSCVFRPLIITLDLVE